MEDGRTVQGDVISFVEMLFRLDLEVGVRSGRYIPYWHQTVTASGACGLTNYYCYLLVIIVMIL